MDILEHVFIERSCERCGTRYWVSARVARDSESMLRECCPVDCDRECPQLQYAAMIDASLLDELAAVWARVEGAARAHGFDFVVASSALAPRTSTDAVDARIDDYRRAKSEALRGACEETSIEHAGHYDTDTHPPSSVVTSDVLEHERDAAVALADEILLRSSTQCCRASSS